ncbi:MAG TPA: hypothetical protein VGO71_07740, partial [Baekduia sp.]|nr:hypothetical protein [Baekduia sp.]
VRASADGIDDAAAGADSAATDDPCVSDVLTTGAWVHEAELSTDDAGTRLFDAVGLVSDAS